MRITFTAVVTLAAVLIAPLTAAAQWEVDSNGSNATVEGIGGGLMYSCASNAPSRGAIVVVFSGISETGERAGYLEVDSDRLTTRWDCTPITGSTMCILANPRHVAVARNFLERGSAAMAVLGTASNPAGAVIVDLAGSSRAIERVKRACR